ncbi:ysa1-sugar-nucleotide hydrolase [Fusarium flagelliforme]|uniref:Ysa1-sugar-nucleotide hydrolase n=1 Tax=Fusarium flagelliforme TaxID=2675880 RepID=A0A395MST4_9HYPO|nr:ysa1-sugar-nucleotide hydrolase [Fusarium flagelliforme]
MSHKTQEPVITKLSDLPIEESKWVTLKKIEYVDQVGKERTWEVATRKTRGKSGVDAVAMGNILLHPSKPASTLLVIQYRPPLDAYTIEWPAGLIDAEETAEEAAVREFKEETGYDCKVLSVSPAQAADPGMTNANMQLAMVEVQLSENEEEPEQRLDDGEHIQREVIPLAELYERLVEYSKRERTVVAAKLFHFAAGMHFAQTQNILRRVEDEVIIAREKTDVPQRQRSCRVGVSVDLIAASAMLPATLPPRSAFFGHFEIIFVQTSVYSIGNNCHVA